jgi:site-specific DNA-methyltransferase (adenine-specific)
VLDPFMGSGTTAIAARRLGRQYAGFELNPEYCAIIDARLAAPEPQLTIKQRKSIARAAKLDARVGAAATATTEEQA